MFDTERFIEECCVVVSFRRIRLDSFDQKYRSYSYIPFHCGININSVVIPSFTVIRVAFYYINPIYN